MSLKKIMKPVYRAGFREADFTTANGIRLRYAYGAENGKTPLLLIHGQTGAWQDYAGVLIDLSEHYQVYAIDCHGHGKSDRVGNYCAEAMCKDFAEFVEKVIGKPIVISGHSSGGLLSAYFAANYPQWVLGAVLEDPPFFSTEQGERWENSFAYVDTYKPIHDFLQQSECTDWAVYYLRHAGWGKFIGADKMEKLADYGVKYRTKHPNKPLKFFFLPESLNRMFWFLDDYDLNFGESFYNGSWFRNYDQSETLARIACPCVLIHTNWSIDESGILMAAMSGEDAERANSLIPNCEIFKIDSGHDSHVEKPERFLAAFARLREKMPL